MKGMRFASIVASAIVPVMVFAAPAHADPDTDFAKELHTYGIYGQKDYNAWIGEITCKRLNNGVDLVVPSTDCTFVRRRASPSH